MLTGLSSVGSTGGAYHRALARFVVLGLVAALLALSPAQGLAKGHKGKKTKDQQAIDQATRLIGENFGPLNDCLDSKNDAKACVEDVILRLGPAFLIAAIIKAVAHWINPTDLPKLDALVQCLESGEDPQTCLHMLDTRVQRLALLLQSYRELPPYCGAPDVLCDRPVDWPSEWPWPFRETRRRSRH